MDYLFNCNFFDDSFDPEDHEDHQDFADKVLQSYSWDEIYGYFFRHLTQDCTTAESVYNATNLYFVYCFDKNPVPNPYELVGYVLFRIDLDKYWDEYGDFIDSFAVSVLESSKKVSLMTDPYYAPWEDPKSLSKWKNAKSNFRTMNQIK